MSTKSQPLNKLPIEVAQEMKWMAWNAAWHAANTRTVGYESDALDNEKKFNQHSENVSKAVVDLALNLSQNTIENIKWGAWNAAWYAANTRAEHKDEAEKDSQKFEQHFQSLKNSNEVTEDLAENIKNMCVYAAWYAANTRKDYKDDAIANLHRFEEFYSRIIEGSYIAKIRFNKLQCLRTTSGGGKDDVYAKFFVDGNYHSRWPNNGDCDMGVGDEAYLDRQFEFKNSLKLELWEYDSTSSDDYMGAYEFDASGRGSGTVILANPEEGDEYKLQYEYLGQKVKTLRLDSAKCVLVSSSIDAKVIDAAFNLASEVSEAAGSVLAKTEHPKAKLIGEALEAGAKVLMRIPELVKAIDEAGGYPDQLYLTRTNQPGVNRRFWPVGEYYEIRSGQIVRFDDVRFPLNSSVDINLWEYDFGSGDDHLGSFSIDPEESLGVHVKTVTSSTECSIYLVAYCVTEEE